MTRRTTLMTFSIVLSCLMPTWCTAATLVMVHDGAREMAEFYNEMIPLFESSHPDVEIERQAVAGGIAGIVEKVRVMVASGAQLDVVEFWPEGASALFNDHILMDIGPYVAAEPGFQQRLVPLRLQSYTWQGNLLGLPLNANAFPTYYNADLLANAGLLSPPQLGQQWNWSVLVEYAKRLTVDTNSDGTPDQWGLLAGPAVLRLPIWLHNAGGSLFDRYSDPTEARLTSPETVSGLRFFTSLFTEHRVTQLGGVPAFVSGKLGFAFDSGPFYVATLAAADVPFQWGLWHRPTGPANNGTILLGTGYIIPKSTRQPDLAWEWVRFCAARPESIQRMYEITARTPAYSPALAGYAKYMRSTFGEAAGPIQDVTANSSNFPGLVLPQLSELQPLIENTMRQILRGEKALESTVTELERQVNLILQGK